MKLRKCVNQVEALINLTVKHHKKVPENTAVYLTLEYLAKVRKEAAKILLEYQSYLMMLANVKFVHEQIHNKHSNN